MASSGDIGFSTNDIKLCNWFGTSGEKGAVQNYRIINRGPVNKNVRAAVKNSGVEVFKLQHGSKECTISAGLSTPVVLLFTPEMPIVYKGVIDIFDDGKLVLTVPINALPPQSNFDISPRELDFGTQVNENQYVSCALRVKNIGNKKGSFEVNSGSSQFEISMTRGTLDCSQSCNLRVRLLCNSVGIKEDNIRFTFDAGSTFIVRAKCSIVQRKLKLISMNDLTSVVDKVVFRNIHYGDVDVQKVILFNDSPIPSTFLIVFDQEKSHCISNHGSLAITMTGSQNTHQIRNLEHDFKVNPHQGYLNAYQKVTIHFKFAPHLSEKKIGWKACETKLIPKEYNVLANISIVEICNQVDNYYSGTTTVALSARALPILVDIIPRSINFGTCVAGSSVQKKIKVVNFCDMLPIKYKVKEIAHYKSSPTSAIIKENGASFVKVIFHPKQLGSIVHRLIIDLWAEKSSRCNPLSSVMLIVKGNCISAPVKECQLLHPYADINDLAQSIRPSTATSDIVVPFTRKTRYTYHDTDYQLKKEDVRLKMLNKESYRIFLKELYNKRRFDERERITMKTSKDHDIGMCPGVGLESPVPTTSNYSNGCKSDTSLNESDCNIEFIECIKALVTDTSNIMRSRALISPNQLKSVCAEPQGLNFGKLCCNVTTENRVSFTNNFNKSVVIKIKINNDELKFKHFSEKQYIEILLKPSTFTIIDLMFSSETIGNFHGSLTYVVNHQQTYSISVSAQVQELSVKVSPKLVNLYDDNSYSVVSGIWGSVNLTNSLDVPLTFNWKSGKSQSECIHLYPINENGVIPSNSTLICGFICRPEFNLSSFMNYELYIHSNSKNSLQPYTDVTFITMFKSPICMSHQKRVLFSNIPVNLISYRAICLENKSESRAYYKVICDSNELNLQVSPSSGSIPAMGVLELNVSVCPLVSGPFDLNVCIKIRESSDINVRVTGSSEIPDIIVEKESFDFGGVLCGSRKCLPYLILNQGKCRAQVTFNLSCLPDFQINLIQQPGYTFEVILEDKETSVLVLELPAKSSAMCELEFHPTQIASYAFYFTVLVNGLLPCSPPGSPWPPCNPHSSISVVNNGFDYVLSHTPIRQVLCTAILSPLKISNNIVEFVIPPISSLPKTPLIYYKRILLENTGKTSITWKLGDTQSKLLTSNSFKLIRLSPEQVFLSPNTKNTILPGEKTELKVLFQPEKFGISSEIIPLFLNEATEPYILIYLIGNLQRSVITTVPSHLVLDPVPIGVTVNKQILVTLDGFAGDKKLDVQLPDFDNRVSCSVNFLDPNETNCNNKISNYKCVLEFKYFNTISMTTYVTILETTSGIRVDIPLMFSADNSIFSVYEFLGQNLNPVVTLNEMKVPIFHYHSNSNREEFNNSTQISRSTINTSEFRELFLKDCLSSICRWISCNGFQNSTTVNFPNDFCSRVVKDIANVKVKERSYMKKSRGMLVDMLSHICGRLPPGIPLNLPPCTTNIDKIIQQYSTYEAVLTFLRNQGAVLSDVLPEFLLEYENYLEWSQQKCKQNPIFGCSDKSSFYKLSEKSWAKVLMQVIKVLVIPKLVSKPFKNDSQSELFQSNLYSTHEMKLLSWLNYHYTLKKSVLFGIQGTKAQARHLIHFDVDLMDCMALSCVLFSYCPFLKSTHFDRLFVEPSSPEQCAHNALVFIDALKNISFSYNIQPSDILSPNPIFMVLFCACLYSTLSLYEPTKEIKFSTKLGKKTNTKIRVSNPTLKTIDYLVLIKGEDQQYFSCASSIIIHPQENEDLNITYFCHSLDSKMATLLLVAKNGNETVTSYSLHGHCTGGKPKVYKRYTAHLYEMISIDIELGKLLNASSKIHNIKLFEMERTLFPDKEDNVTNLLLSDKGRKVRMFYSHKNQENSVKFLPVQFIGLRIGIHQCYVILTTSEFIDYIFSIAVEVKNPFPVIPQLAIDNQHVTTNLETNTMHLSTFVHEVVKGKLIIYPTNHAFENALVNMSKRELTEKELERHEAADTLKYAALLSNVFQQFGNDMLCNINDDIITVSIEVKGSQYFRFPLVLNVPIHGSTELPFEFSCSTEGQHECQVMMKSGLDIRMLVFEATVLPKDKHAQIEFKTNATQSLTQKIPLINPTTSNWTLKAHTVNPKFIGPQEVEVPALSTVSYPLTFYSQKEGKYFGNLRLVNPEDSIEHSYELFGFARKPCAQGIISLQGQVDKRLTHLINVPNHKDRTVTFKVASDLDFIGGSKELVVGGNDKVDYCISIFPKKSGYFSGTLVFKVAEFDSGDSSHKKDHAYHIWYQVTCLVEPKTPEKVITAVCPVLSTKKVIIDIPKRNGVRTEDLEVKFNGEFLTGPLKSLAQDTTFAFVYTPLHIGRSKGRIYFSSSTESEFWYEVCLEAVDPEVTILPTLTCEIGRSCERDICLQNPLDRELHVTCYNSNITHYSMSQKKFCIGPKTQQCVKVLFNPSTLGSDGHCVDIICTSTEVGKQVFSITGVGEAPIEPEPITMKSILNSSTSHSLSFRNPLRYDASLTFSMKGKDSRSFTTFMRGSEDPCVLSEGKSIDLAIVFSPTEMYKHEAVFCISTEMTCSHEYCEASCNEVHKICWLYSLFGQPQVILTPFDKAPKLIAKTKTVIERMMTVQLNESSDVHNAVIFKKQNQEFPEISIFNYSYTVHSKNEQFLAIINKYLKVQLVGEEDMTLTFRITFSPPKEIVGICEIHICNQEGGLWILPLQISIKISIPDDIITIESIGLNRTAQTSFYLTSTCQTPLPFSAHFIGGSDPAISVTPTSGILLPNDTDGTQFVASYKPTTYGKHHSAKYVIKCDMAEWCYEIIGKLPKVKHSHPNYINLNS